ncbi:hypothetical protein N7520_004929 [Penicillium odoratum]|uniref:uncharacterized protein n=1 Tax=Penicillium odoratum TaxID=1167516 RepID=UPI002546BEBE|nr:uncharacterized protein N7520_004929 [Penicillium odoratum]KAJ5765370.1 hypothetical protein N7520_004929 [Penicillium odoratum]
MRFYTVALLTGATAATAGSTANLLLPGFQGRDMQAGVLGQDGDATTYLITCPTSVASSACGIPGKGMTAISAPSSAQLINTNGANTASLSCNVAGTTYASCFAQEGTVTVHQTLAASNINWMAVTVTGPCSTSTPTPTPTQTPTSTPTSTSTSTSTSTHSSTSTVTPSSASTSFPASTPKKSPSKSASRMPSSTPLITGAPTATAANPVPTTAAPSTPVTGGAASIARNGWVLGGALALAYALV